MQSYELKRDTVLDFIKKSQMVIESLYESHTWSKYSLTYPKRFDAYSTKLEGQSNSMGQKEKEGFKVLNIPGELRHLADLDSATLGTLLGLKLNEVIAYLKRLATRVADKHSRILITGDVNSGKSTIVNSLLQCDILPVDQQPCTQSFCEVTCAPDGIAKTFVHGATDYTSYSSRDLETFDQLSLDQMQNWIQDESCKYQLFKVYLATDKSDGLSSYSLDIGFIDSPGLNSDMFKTMSLFSKQEDIDVIVFVINAANHLTLSARQFLQSAGREKELVFLVINKFDEIKNRDKCRNMVLSQIKEVLPQTFEHRDELVHFVSAKKYLETLSSTSLMLSPSEVPVQQHFTNSKDDVYDFAIAFQRLEMHLKQFVCDKRTQSKLLPARSFLLLLLSELICLLEYNEEIKAEGIGEVDQELSIITPCFESLIAHNGLIHADLRKCVDDVCRDFYKDGTEFLKSIEAKTILQKIPWSGFLNIYKFRDIVHNTVLRAERLNIRELLQMAHLRQEKGIQDLNLIALEHTHGVFRDSKYENSAPESDLFECVRSVSIPVLPSFWKIFDVKALFVGSSWLTAGTLASAIFGYQPLFSLGLRILDSSKSMSRIVSVAILASLGVFATVNLLGDIECVIRSALLQHYQSFHLSSEWTIEPARLVEAKLKSALASHQNFYTNTFDHALHQQRQLQASKELQKTQTLVALKFVQDRLQSTRRLHLLIQKYEL